MKKEDNIPALSDLLPTDDETVEQMAEEYPFLSETDKARILQASEAKYSKLCGDAAQADAKTDTDITQYQPMEQTPVRSYRKIVEIAACLLVIAGVVAGIAIPLSRQPWPSSSTADPPSTETSHAPAQSSEPMQQSTTEPTVTKTQEAATTTAAAAANDERAQLEAQMKDEIIPALIDGLKRIDSMSRGTDECYADPETFVQNNREYAPVHPDATAARLGGVAGIRTYMQKYLTESLIQTRYSSLLDGDMPRYLERDNALYGATDSIQAYLPDYSAVGGFTFALQKKYPAREETIDACEVTLALNTYTNTFSGLRLELMYTNGEWKIDDIQIDLVNASPGSVTGDNDSWEAARLLYVEHLRIQTLVRNGITLFDPNDYFATYENEGDFEQTTPLIWYRVKDPRFSTMAEFKAYIRAFFTQSYAQVAEGDFFVRFRERNGALYALPTAADMNCTYEGISVEKITENGTSVVANISDKQNADRFPSNIQGPTMTIVKEGNVWKIDKMEY